VTICSVKHSTVYKYSEPVLSSHNEAHQPPRLADFARPSFPPGRRLGEGLLELCGRVHREFRYDREATTLDTPVREVLRKRRGVCQDFAHVTIGALRSLGIPARYVSGYLRTRRGDAALEAASSAAGEGAQPSPQTPPKKLVGSEASHAWLSAWDPDLGWLDIDPTNDLVPGDRHVILAWGRDYDDVSPVKGVTLGGGGHTVEVAVEVRPERPTAPGAGPAGY
jgi:transglutaminase-like putative cysteine protease